MLFSLNHHVLCFIQDEPYSDALARLHDTVARAHRINPDIFFEVFIHKVDGDLFLFDELKIDCQRDIQLHITEGLTDANLDIHLSFYLTRLVRDDVVGWLTNPSLLAAFMTTASSKLSAKLCRS